MPEGVYADSDKIREFAGELNTFAILVNERMRAIKARTSDLGDSWLDQGFKDFEAEFSLTWKHLQQFAEEVQRVSPKLEQDAATLDTYHGIKP